MQGIGSIGNLSNLDSFVRIEKLTENMICFAESKLGSSEYDLKKLDEMFAYYADKG